MKFTDLCKTKVFKTLNLSCPFGNYVITITLLRASLSVRPVVDQEPILVLYTELLRRFHSIYK